MIRICSLQNDEWEFVSDIVPAEKNIPSDTKILYAALDENSDICGVLIIEYDFYAYQIDFLYVVPEMRRQGIATKLMDTFLEKVRKNPLGMDVIADLLMTKQTKELGHFFVSRDDFDMMDSDNMYRVYAGDLHQYPMVKKMLESHDPKHIKSLAQCTDKEWTYYINELGHKYSDLLRDLNREELDEKLTQFYIDQHGEPKAMIATEKPEGDLLRVLIATFGRSNNSILLNLFGSIFNVYKDNYKDMYVEFMITDSQRITALKMLFGEYLEELSNNRFIYNWI